MAMLAIDTFGCLFFLLQGRKLTCPNANDYVQSLGSKETRKNRKVVIGYG